MKVVRGTKRCPFCGSKKLSVIISDPILKTYHVHCDSCFAFGPPKVKKNKALLAWHNRVNDSRRIVTPSIDMGAVERAKYEGVIRGLKSAIKILSRSQCKK